MGVTLEVEVPGGRGWVGTLAERVTDADGRVRDLVEPGSAFRPRAGYRLTFATSAWFEARGEGWLPP